MPDTTSTTPRFRRESLLAKIRALLAKTVENGCTEGEYLAALAKARAMQDAYEVTDEELELTREEKAKLHPADNSDDPHGIKWALVSAVASFTDTKVFRRFKDKKIVFIGLPSDTEFAHWLLASLQAFVQAELADHLAASLAPRGMRRRVINGFVFGCTARISERMEELCRPMQSATSNSRALVLTKQAAIKDVIKAEGLRFRSCSTRRVTDAGSYVAGLKAGDRASFGRPMGSSGRLRIGGGR